MHALGTDAVAIPWRGLITTWARVPARQIRAPALGLQLFFLLSVGTVSLSADTQIVKVTTFPAASEPIRASWDQGPDTGWHLEAASGVLLHDLAFP